MCPRRMGERGTHSSPSPRMSACVPTSVHVALLPELFLGGAGHFLGDFLTSQLVGKCTEVLRF